MFRFLQREGRDHDTARELTQEFFARLLARRGLDTVQPGRGKFRSFLLGAVKHFLADVRDHEHRFKRGGGNRPASLEAPIVGGDTSADTSPGMQVPDPQATPPDTFFDRHWALTLMERGLSAVEKEFAASGKHEQFDVLKPWLAGEMPALSQCDAARRLGMTEGALKVAVHRLRKRFSRIDPQRNRAND